MKKFLLIILCFFAAVQLNAQNVQWGNTVKLNQYMNAMYVIVQGKYLGEIDGSDYYTYYGYFPKFLKMPDTQLAFIQANGTTTKKFSDLTTTEYDMLDVFNVENQFAVFYVTGKKLEKRNIKVDFYTPNSFKKEKSDVLFSFDPINKNYPFMKIIRSKNEKYIGFVVNGKHPETGNGTLIFKCYDDKLNELWTSYYDVKSEGYPEIGNIILSDNGKMVIQFIVYNNDDKKRLISLNFTEINDNSTKDLEYEFENPKIELIDFMLGSYGENQYLMVFTEEKNITGIKVDFDSESLTKVISHNPYKGNWHIDDIIDLKNGKYTVAMQNRGIESVTRVQNNGMTSTTYYYWNRSFMFIGIENATDEILYKKYLGRKFTISQGTQTYNLNMNIVPHYFVNNGELSVIYNTDKKTENNESNEKESKFVVTSFTFKSMKSDTRMATITDGGKINVKVLFDSKTAKGYYLSNFTHFDKNNDLLILIAKGKKTTLGKVKL